MACTTANLKCQQKDATLVPAPPQQPAAENRMSENSLEKNSGTSWRKTSRRFLRQSDSKVASVAFCDRKWQASVKGKVARESTWTRIVQSSSA